jgi:1,4-alpha-glucan branching enzyme
MGALAAAGIAIAAIFGLRREAERNVAEEMRRTDQHPIPGQTGEYRVAQKTDTVYVQRFVFVAPDAKQVALAGDFNDWDASRTRLAKSEHPGVWTADVPLSPGRYSYAFVVDGERWVADPRAPKAVGDDFDRPSSTVTVREAQSL